MRQSLLLILLLLLVFYATPTSIAYRMPLGDAYPSVHVEDNQFAVYWTNTLTKKIYRSIYSFKRNKLKRIKTVDQRPPHIGQSWYNNTNEIPELYSYFARYESIRFQQYDTWKILSGLSNTRSYSFLKIVILNSNNTLIAQKEVDYLAIAGNPLVSNIEFEGDCLYFAWGYLVWENFDLSIDLVLSRWNIKTDEIQDLFLHKRMGHNTIFSIARINKTIGVVYSQYKKELGHHIVFRAVDIEKMEEINSVIIQSKKS